MNAPDHRRNQPLRFWLGAGTVVLLMLVILAIFLPSGLPKAPAYGGRSLSFWLRALHNPKSSPADQLAAQLAIRAMGTNIVPVLLNGMSEPGESTLARWVDAAGDLGLRYRLPMHWVWSSTGLLRLSVGFFDDPTRREAARAIFAAYVNSEPNDPRQQARAQNLALTFFNLGDCSYSLLAASLTNTQPRVRAKAASWVGFTSQTPTNFIGALIERASDPDPGVRFHAVGSLGRFRKHAADVVPVVAAALRDGDSGVRSVALSVLASYGGAAKPALPALMDLAARDPQWRMICLDCVRRIAPDEADRLVAGLRTNRTPNIPSDQEGAAQSRGANHHE